MKTWNICDNKGLLTNSNLMSNSIKNTLILDKVVNSIYGQM